MKTNAILLIVTCLSSLGLSAQHVNRVNASLNAEKHEIKIQQEFLYVNQSKDTLATLYFNDWANAYASKDSPVLSGKAND
jgi:hypothetical protein